MVGAVDEGAAEWPQDPQKRFAGGTGLEQFGQVLKAA
jgi:hypothetical protein